MQSFLRRLESIKLAIKKNRFNNKTVFINDVHLGDPSPNLNEFRVNVSTVMVNYKKMNNTLFAWLIINYNHFICLHLNDDVVFLFFFLKHNYFG